MSFVRTRTPAEVREDLLQKREIALLDVREEAVHATGHPLFAANLSLSRIELDAYTRLPNRAVNIVLFGEDDAQANQAADRLHAMEYGDVKLLEGGLQGWRDAGYEIFIDVNAPSKAFGELVEAERHTPSLKAQDVQAMIDRQDDVVIVDARRYDEFQTMSIPTGISVPGAELVLRIRELAPDPQTKVIVNCAGRTRSIIGTQSLVNAGIPNQVAALRNGTIGWKLAKQQLAHGASKKFPSVSHEIREQAAADARHVANRAGVRRLTGEGLAELLQDETATVYRFDVRTPEEYKMGHLPGFHHAPGGQLVQETDMFAPVRGASITLVDDDGSRANMTASWLAQMGWNVFVLDGVKHDAFNEQGFPVRRTPPYSEISSECFLSSETLTEQMRSGETILLDFSPSREYARGHIDGAWFAIRSELPRLLASFEGANRFVVTANDPAMTRFAYGDLKKLTSKQVFLFEGVHEQTTELPRFGSQPLDRYQRPYEGTTATPEAMQAYLDWEAGLVDQLSRDGTHHFHVI